MKKIFSAVMALSLMLTAMMTNTNAQQEVLYATKIAPKTAAASLEGLKVTRDEATVEDTVATGDIIEKEGKEYIAVVCGDVNGDASINSTDFMKIRYAYLGIRSLDELSQMAADVNFDGKINSTDFMQVRRYYLGLFDLCDDSEIDFGKGASASVENRPVMYYSKEEQEYFSPATRELFGDMEFINNYDNYDQYADYENAALADTTKEISFEGKDYTVKYKMNIKYADFDDYVIRYDGVGCSAYYNEKTGKLTRLYAKEFDGIDVENTDEQELKSTALELISTYTDFVVDESYEYSCVTYYDTYTKKQDGTGYKTDFKGTLGYYEPEDAPDGAEYYEVVRSFDVKFTQYVNGIKTDNRAVVRFDRDYVNISVYDIDFDSVSFDKERVTDDFEVMLANVTDDVFIDGKYEMSEPLLYKRDGRLYVRVYCTGDFKTSLEEEWQVKGAYFVLDYGEE